MFPGYKCSTQPEPQWWHQKTAMNAPDREPRSDGYGYRFRTERIPPASVGIAIHATMIVKSPSTESSMILFERVCVCSLTPGYAPIADGKLENPLQSARIVETVSGARSTESSESNSSRLGPQPSTPFFLPSRLVGSLMYVRTEPKYKLKEPQ